MSTFDLNSACTDLGVGGRLGPLTSSISLGLTSGNLELDEGLKASEKPLLDEFGKDDTELACSGVNLLTKVTGHVKDDLLELKEDDFDSLDENDVLGDDLLPPGSLQLNGLGLDALTTYFLFHFGLFFRNLFVDHGFLGVLIHLLNLGFLALNVLDFGLTGSHTLCPGLDLLINGQEERILLDVLGEFLFGKFILEARAGRVVFLDHLDDFLDSQMRAG